MITHLLQIDAFGHGGLMNSRVISIIISRALLERLKNDKADKNNIFKKVYNRFTVIIESNKVSILSEMAWLK